MNTVNVVFSRLICLLISFPVIVIWARNLAGLRLEWPRLGDDIAASSLATSSKHQDVYQSFCPFEILQNGKSLFLTTLKSVASNRIKNAGIIF